MNYRNITEDYISGYLEAISRVKDLITPNLGGFNMFFRIPKDKSKTLFENIQNYIILNKSWYKKYSENEFKNLLESIQLVEITDWNDKFESIISDWTCDIDLAKINGKNGYFLSEYLINFMLKNFFKEQKVTLFKMLPESEFWHWGDQISSEFIFETKNDIYIMHFGESS